MRLARSARIQARACSWLARAGTGGGTVLAPGAAGVPGRRGGEADLAGQQGVGQGAGVLVVIQQPGGRLVPVTVRVQPSGQGTSMIAEQVVQPVPALGQL